MVGAGLQNLGNSCFMNATLQCLAHTPPLAEYMQRRCHSSECRKSQKQVSSASSTDFCAACCLEHLVNQLFMGNDNSIVPSDFANRLSFFCPGFRLGTQEDAHEFLRGFLGQLTKSFKSSSTTAAVGDETVIQRWFQGWLQSQVHCMTCGAESNTLEPFLDLSIELYAPGGGIFSSLKEAMHCFFIEKEHLAGDNSYCCQACGKLSCAEKCSRMSKNATPYS